MVLVLLLGIGVWVGVTRLKKAPAITPIKSEPFDSIDSVVRQVIHMSRKYTKKLLSVYFKSEIRTGIKDLRAYTDKIMKYLESQKYKIYEDEASEGSETKEEKDTNDLLFSISLRLGYGRHVDIFTKSAIISIYTYLEFFLDDFCKKTHAHNGESISPKDLSGNGIFKSRAYLEKVLFINFSNLSDEWNDLVKLNKIRNFLIHSNGVSTNEETRSKISKTIQGISGVKLEEDHLNVSLSYIWHMLSVIEKTLTEIESQYSKNTEPRRGK